MSDHVKHRAEFDYFCVPCFRPVMDAEVVGWEREDEKRGGPRPLCPACTDPVDQERTPPTCMDPDCPDYRAWLDEIVDRIKKDLLALVDPARWLREHGPK